MTPEERQKMRAEQEAAEAWSVKDMISVRFNNVEEAQEIIDLCEMGMLFEPWKPTSTHPAHFRTEIGFVRADDYDEAKNYLLKEELKAELKVKPKKPHAEARMEQVKACFWRHRREMPAHKISDVINRVYEELDVNGDFGMKKKHMAEMIRKWLREEHPDELD